MKPLVAVTVAVVAFLGASDAQAGWVQTSPHAGQDRVAPVLPSLESVALNVTGRGILIHQRGDDTGYAGSTWVGFNEVWLTRDVLVSAAAGRGIGMLIFLHELGHTSGISDEGLANCYALSHLRPVLRDLYGFTAARAQTEFQVAVNYMHAESAVYQCEVPQ